MNLALITAPAFPTAKYALEELIVMLTEGRQVLATYEALRVDVPENLKRNLSRVEREIEDQNAAARAHKIAVLEAKRKHYLSRSAHLDAIDKELSELRGTAATGTAANG